MLFSRLASLYPPSRATSQSAPTPPLSSATLHSLTTTPTRRITPLQPPPTPRRNRTRRRMDSPSPVPLRISRTIGNNRLNPRRRRARQQQRRRTRDFIIPRASRIPTSSDSSPLPFTLRRSRRRLNAINVTDALPPYSSSSEFSPPLSPTRRHINAPSTAFTTQQGTSAPRRTNSLPTRRTHSTLYTQEATRFLDSLHAQLEESPPSSASITTTSPIFSGQGTPLRAPFSNRSNHSTSTNTDEGLQSSLLALPPTDVGSVLRISTPPSNASNISAPNVYTAPLATQSMPALSPTTWGQFANYVEVSNTGESTAPSTNAPGATRPGDIVQPRADPPNQTPLGTDGNLRMMNGTRSRTPSTII